VGPSFWGLALGFYFFFIGGPFIHMLGGATVSDLHKFEIAGMYIDVDKTHVDEFNKMYPGLAGGNPSFNQKHDCPPEFQAYQLSHWFMPVNGQPVGVQLYICRRK
jgi:hypothetical protein